MVPAQMRSVTSGQAKEYKRISQVGRVHSAIRAKRAWTLSMVVFAAPVEIGA